MMKWFLVVLAVYGIAASDPSYDRQSETYNSQFKSASTTDSVTITPYFAPEHSTQMYVDLINSAQTSIDIGSPGFDSWSKCTKSTGCSGCTIDDMANEAFPVFPAVLNAIHLRGVTVRLLVPADYQKTCTSEIQPLDWWALNGVSIVNYASTTFMHAKYLNIDGKKVSVSSINFSKTSFTHNREAGMVVEHPDLVAMYNKVFEYDFNNGVPYKVANHYTASQMDTITDKSEMPVTVPDFTPKPGAYVTPDPTPISTQSGSTTTAWTSPDFARSMLMPQLQAVKKSFAIYIYQITDMGLCTQLQTMNQSGIDLTILVGNRILSYNDQLAANKCYGQLNDAGIQVRITSHNYMFSHQKFWIFDNTTVSLSTGNWSPTDLPDGDSFPAYGDDGWHSVNRDFYVTSDDPDVVGVFYTTLQEDYKRGDWWTPKSFLA